MPGWKLTLIACDVWSGAYFLLVQLVSPVYVPKLPIIYLYWSLKPQYATKFFAGANDVLIMGLSFKFPNLSSDKENVGVVIVTEPG